MKKLLTLASIVICTNIFGQKPASPAPTTPAPATTPPPKTPAEQGPKKYADLITDKAVTKPGLFTVHKIDEKWYFDIPDSVLNREIMVVTRFSKVAGGAQVYGGELANSQTIIWEKGPNNNLFLRVVTTISQADSTNDIYKAVTSSYLNPIAAAFDIKAFGKDSSSYIIDVSDFFKGDNQAVSLHPFYKRRLNLGGLASDRSFIQSIKTFPTNTEIKTVKTFNSSPSFGPQAPGTTSLPAADASGAVTLELNTSFIALPKIPMKKRLFDPRVGFFADDYTVYSDNQQKVFDEEFIVRWRLEPKDEDMEKWKNGQLVEPKKPIIYYIDPATPKKWHPYLIAGVNDWQKAFEKAGFKNAIMAKEWPVGDSTMSMEDARFSVIRYFASDIENAYGPNVHDPRSGEILESHIGWYHNVMKLLHDWYMVQTAAVDPNARKMTFDDTLMGNLIRFVSSHEIGHTLGLRHNMGSSSRTPVELLRNKKWVEANGHTASIMDYARFNYVAQPEDSISEIGLFPRIGEYDKWAIKWGYTPTATTDAKEDEKIVNKWAIDSLTANPRLWFGTETNPFDPRSQTEDLGDNSVKASEYGIKNLKRIMAQLPDWTKEEADKYENLQEMYDQVTIQFNRYMNHVLRNVGGVYETPKSVEQKGDVYEPAPKATQKEAVAFLNKQLFDSPYWLVDKNIINKFNSPVTNDALANMQTSVLNSLLGPARLNRLAISGTRFGAANTYPPDEMLDDVKKGIWSELVTKKTIESYRRNLQKTYTEALIAILNPQGNSISIQGLPPAFAALFNNNVKNTDIPSIARANLTGLRTEILAALPTTTDKLSKYHLQDVAERIKRALDPK